MYAGFHIPGNYRRRGHHRRHHRHHHRNGAGGPKKEGEEGPDGPRPGLYRYLILCKSIQERKR